MADLMRTMERAGRGPGLKLARVTLWRVDYR